MLDLIIKNGKCYIDKDLKDVDIGIQNSKIVKIGKLNEDAIQTIDASGLTVLPGCIDTQTHFREPGSTDTEDLHSGSRIERSLADPRCRRDAADVPDSRTLGTAGCDHDLGRTVEAYGG